MQANSIAECSLGGILQIILTFIELPFVIVSFVFSIFEVPFYIGFTVNVKFTKHTDIHKHVVTHARNRCAT